VTQPSPIVLFTGVQRMARELRQQGYQTACLLEPGEKVPSPQEVEHWIPYDPRDLSSLERWAAQWPLRDRVVAVINRRERRVMEYALLNRALSKPGIRPEQAGILRDKLLLRQTLARAAPYLNPPFGEVGAPGESPPPVPFPFLIKPRNLFKSQLITLCRNPEEFRAGALHFFREREPAGHRHGVEVASSALAEALVQGQEASLDGLVTEEGRLIFTPLVRVTPAREWGMEDFHVALRSLPSPFSLPETEQAREAVAQGKVHNRLALDRSLFPADEFEKRMQSDTAKDSRAMGGAGENSNGVSLAALKDSGWIEADASGVYRWNLDGWTESDLRLELTGWPEKSASVLIELWKQGYTFPQGKIGDHLVVQRLEEAGLIHRDSAEGKPREYYRFPTVRIEEVELTQRIREAGISDLSAPLAAWRNDESVSVSKITKFLPPFDLKGGGLMAVWSFIVFIGLQWWASAAGGGYLAQRLFSCKNEKHSMLAILWYNLAHFALRPWPWLVVGVASLFMIPDITEYGKHFDAEYAYVVMFMKFLPVGLRGLMVASLMAAFMSTISTHVNFGASYLVNDFYKRFLNRRATDRHYVRVSETLSIFLAILAGVYAFYSSSIADSWLTIFMLLSGTSFVYLLRWYWWRVNAWSEIAAMIASIAVSLLLMHTQFFQGILGPLGVPRWWLDHYPVQYTLTIIFSTVVWIAVTLLTRPVSMKHLVEFYQRVRPAGWWRPVADAAGRADYLKVGLLEWGCWLIGSSGLLAMIIALGKLCFGMYLSALGLAVYAAVATVFLFKGIGRMDWSSLEGPKKEPIRKAG